MSSVQNLIRRILHGIKECTNSTHLSWRHMHKRNERLRRENNSRKLDVLTLARKLGRVMSKLDQHKRLVYAIAESNIPRVQVVVSVTLRNKRRAGGILQQLKRAQDQVYKPRSFTEADYSLSNLILRLGGDAALGVALRACGLPTRSTVHRHSRVPTLRISHGYPTIADISANIDSVFPLTVPAPTHGSRVGMVLIIDETKLERRLRWEPKTNAIVGTCREHSGHLDLIFCSMDQARAVADALQTDKVHYATEMTVAALGLVVPNSREHVAWPIQISGLCKRENAKEHAALIQTLVTAAESHAKLENARVLCIATDGEAKRGSALVPICLSHSLPATSPIYAVLRRLLLFNLLCGLNNLTLNKDYKHLFKRYRGMLLRTQGIDIFGFIITADMVKRHLLDSGLEPSHVQSLVDTNTTPSETALACSRQHLLGNGMTPAHIEALMNPNDKQDVVLAYSLLVAVMKLPLADRTVHDKSYWQVRRRLNVLGKLFGYLLKPYTTLSMSLSEQMKSLSSAMHMLLALYSSGRGSVMPVQLYADTAHMVKNAFFCVARLQVDDPEGLLHLILLGNDRLEAGFGNMRCMQASDSNADILQGTSRFATGMEVAIVFAEHPEWDQTKRCLYLAPLDTQGDIVDRNVDHISPRSWTGNVHVKHVSLLTCWDSGRHAAEAELVLLSHESPFACMVSAGNIDMLHPLGRWCFNDSLLDGEVDKVVDDAANVTSATADGNEMDLEDHAAPELADALIEEHGPHAAHEPWVLDGSDKIFKASVCRLISDPAQLASGSSTDRMRRFAGFNKYDYGAPSDAAPHADDEEDFLMVNDTAATLLRCQDIAFLAFILVSSLKVNTQTTQSIYRASASSMQVGFQVLRLIPQTPRPDSAYDWRCVAETVRFGTTNTMLWTSASLVEPIDQAVQIPQDGIAAAARTEFTTDKLNVLTRLLLESTDASPDLDLPSVSRVERFPYHLDGKLCFTARKPDNALVGADRLKCSMCTSSKLKIDTSIALLTHNAAHLLYNTSLRRNIDYCGFCLSTSDTCRFYLKRSGGDTKNQQIDLGNSKCPKLPDQISYGPASKSSKKTPGTNVPLCCPRCEERAPAVWRYNLLRHFQKCHPDVDVDEYKKLWELSSAEKNGLHDLWERLGNLRNTRKASPPPLPLSDAHSSDMAMRTTDLATSTAIVPPAAAACSNTPVISEAAGSLEPGHSAVEHEASVPPPESSIGSVRTQESVRTMSDAQVPSDATLIEPGSIDGDTHMESGTVSSSAVISTSQAPATTGDGPATSSSLGKRKRIAHMQSLRTCNCGKAISAGDGRREGVVECIAEGCETLYYHEHCALEELKARALPTRFICASCKAEGATYSKCRRE